MYLASTRLSLWTSLWDMGRENERRGAVLQPDHSNSSCFRDPGVPVSNGCRSAMKFAMQISPKSEVMWFSIKSEKSSTYWVTEESLIMDGQQVCVVTNCSISFDTMDLIRIQGAPKKWLKLFSNTGFRSFGYLSGDINHLFLLKFDKNLKHWGQ